MIRNGEPLDAIILAGGKGTRLRQVVADVPKPLAPVNGRPFLDYQLALLSGSGRIGVVVLATGHLSHKIDEYYSAHSPPIGLRLAVETELLGTGGGVANALAQTTTERILVLNGDSIFRWNLDLLSSALDGLKAADGGVSLGIVEVDDRSRYGGVDVDKGRVSGFREKTATARSGLINAGAYLFDRCVLERIPRHSVFSLEYDLFPGMVKERRVAAAVHDSDFVDIGVPESYAAAEAILKGLQVDVRDRP